ncbi:MAG: hypothetical protein WC071_09085 [Victivallaceae bacterium]
MAESRSTDVFIRKVISYLKRKTSVWKDDDEEPVVDIVDVNKILEEVRLANRDNSSFSLYNFPAERASIKSQHAWMDKIWKNVDDMNEGGDIYGGSKFEKMRLLKGNNIIPLPEDEEFEIDPDLV